MHQIAHFGNHSLLPGPRGPAEEMAWVFAHYPEEWNAFQQELKDKGESETEGAILVVDLLSAWDRTVMPRRETPPLEEVQALFSALYPVCRRGLQTLDSGLTDHVLWAGSDGLRRALKVATRYVHETGRAQLMM